jgi:SAM-dependent methyltransferase
MNRRGRFQGVLQIWQYNRRFYLLTLAGLPVAALAAAWLPLWPRLLVLTGAAAAVFWTVASLAVSHYVYDRSSLYDFSWVRKRIELPIEAMASFHAGLDECSELLRTQLPEARLRIFDIFNPREMTEPSIARARKLAAENPGSESANWRSLAARSGEFDASFVIFAAHELRRREARVELFQELARVTRAGGTIVVMEHLRDLPNFLAFGPGFLHFLPRREWLLAAKTAGLQRESEFSVTPFVRVFMFRRS